jgi:hypothetical protein
MRVRHIEHAVQGLYGLKPRLPRAPGLRRPLCRALAVPAHRTVTTKRLTRACSTWPISPASSATSGGPAFEEKTARLAQLCEETKELYLDNREALIDSEGQLANWSTPRLNRGGQVRWSAQGAHRVLQVRAAILDGRLHAQTLLAAA